MNIQAILFMCNDFARAKFTLENFSRWNPEIPIRIINSGGNSPRPHLEHIPNTEFIDAPNLWHKQTVCGIGSFGPKYYDYLFEYGLNNQYTHTLLLETDVLTQRKIIKQPTYDISGITNFGGHESIYNFLNIDGHKLHSGCGGTLLSYNYFERIASDKNIKDLFNILFDKFSEYYYMDFITTIIGRKAGCSLGNWSEVSETKSYHGIHMDKEYLVLPNPAATLIHNYKI